MFKKYFLIVLLILGVCFGTAAVTLAADSVALEWSANSEPDLAGYYLYRTTSQGIYTFGGPGSPDLVGEIDCAPGDDSCTNFIDLNIPTGTYWYVVTAHDTESLESGPSNQVTTTIFPPEVGIPPANPNFLRFQ